jgi:hypothetical protein
MPSLPELQRDFAHAIFGGGAASLDALIEGAAALDAPAALAVYRNNVLSNYRNALLDDYPAVAALVGEEFFAGACDAYARAHASPSGDLNDFGATFPAFLGEWAPAASLPYLPDVARLERAIHLSFHGPDQPGPELTRLAQIAPDRLTQLRFTLDPGATLLESPFPIFRIWRMSTSGADERVELDAGGDRLLVIRRQGTVEIEPLDVAEWTALQALHRGADLAAAAGLALAVDPAFDLGAFLQRHVLAATLTDFHLPDGSQP